jgi:hypothetical protein
MFFLSILIQSRLLARILANNQISYTKPLLLLTQLFRLQAGAAKAAGPTLTLPVR